MRDIAAIESRSVQQVERPFSVGFRHRLIEADGVFAPASGVLAGVMRGGAGERTRAVVFVDDGLARARPGVVGEVGAYFGAHASTVELTGDPVLVPGGEGVKNDWREVDGILRAIDASRVCRQSYVVAVGGGAVLDAVGLGAAVAHRGVRLVRVPTTTLAQSDSGVGVKNGVNAFGRKNYLGTFAPPWAVINDPSLLATLDERDWRCGFSEAVKVALVKDAGFFAEIERAAPRIAGRDLAAARPVLWRSAVMHLDHIALGGDAFEVTTARPLDFGHWSAHKLEAVTGFSLKHGEAVAVGIAIDAVYSVLRGWLSPPEGERVLACLEALGFVLGHAALGDIGVLMDGLEEFREHLGGRLTVSMLAGIGLGFDVHEIDRACMLDAIGVVRGRASGRAQEGA